MFFDVSEPLHMSRPKLRMPIFPNKYLPKEKKLLNALAVAALGAEQK